MSEVETAGRRSRSDIEWFEGRLRAALGRMANVRGARVHREARAAFRWLARTDFHWDTLRIEILGTGLWIELIAGDAEASLDGPAAVPIRSFSEPDAIGARVRLDDWPGVRFGGPDLHSLRVDIDRQVGGGTLRNTI